MATTERGAGAVGDRPSGGRYTDLAIHLHWITPPLVLAQVVLAWVALSLPDNAPNSGQLFSLHKSLGLTIWLLVLARLVWRALNPPPAEGANIPGWMRAASKVSHWLLYLVLFAMPISGYVLSATSKYGVSFWGLPLPKLPPSESLHNLAEFGHSAAQWVLYALVLLHAGATAWHVAVRRDGTLQRMLPAQTHADPRPM